MTSKPKHTHSRALALAALTALAASPLAGCVEAHHPTETTDAGGPGRMPPDGADATTPFDAAMIADAARPEVRLDGGAPEDADAPDAYYPDGIRG
ncbi:MAG: hypothetical protein KF729_03475 [Sandaracinaceae bacterium]|nr:hypothetical protein [Sandaracinaceae bacterium]